MSSDPHIQTMKFVGEAIILQERVANYLHNKQRMQDLEKAPLHDRVAHVLEVMNGQLSMPDEKREVALAGMTRDLLRNSHIKSHLAQFIALQAQINRLSQLMKISGRVDARLLEDTLVTSMSPQELLYLQRSVHTQQSEILKYLSEVRSEGLEAVMQNLMPQQSQETQNTMVAFGKLPSKQREAVRTFITALIQKAGEKSTPHELDT